MTKLNRKTIFVTAGVLAALGVIAVATAGGPAGSRHDDMQPIQYAHTVTAPLATRPSSPGQLLAAVRARMPGSVIVDATIGAPPAWASQHERETETDARGTPGDPFLYITVKADGDGPAAVRPYWEAELLGGALLDELHSHGHRPLSSVQIAVRLPDGTTREVGGGIGNVVSGQQFSTASDQSIADRIRSGAAAAGLTVRSIKFVHPLQAAPVVVLQTTDVAGFAERSYQTQTFEQILGDFTNYEGWYLEVDDTDGAPVTIVTGVGRLGTGQRWVRPGLPTIDNRSYGP